MLLEKYCCIFISSDLITIDFTTHTKIVDGACIDKSVLRENSPMFSNIAGNEKKWVNKFLCKLSHASITLIYKMQLYRLYTYHRPKFSERESSL